MWKLLSTIQKNLIWAVPISMILGFITGISTDPSPLKSLILPFTFLMVYPMMVNLPLKKIVEGGDTKVQVTTQLINFALIPFVAFGIGRWLFPESPFVAMGILLAALLPTSGMTISWTGMAKGNMPAAVKMTVFGLLIGSVATPFYVKALMGASVDIPLQKIFIQIAVVILLPLILGNITQRFIIKKYGMPKYQKDIKQKFPPISTLGVLAIVFVAMALKSQSIMSNPQKFVSMIPPLVLLYAINLAVSTFVAKKFFNRGDGIALVYGTVLRNLSIALAIAMTALGSKGADAALVIALAYIIQIQVAAWYVKLTPKVFGPAPDVAQNVMREGVLALHTNDTLHSAVKLLAEEHVYSVAVLDEANKAVGMLDSNQVLDALAEQKAMDTLLSSMDLAPVVTARPDTPLQAVLQKMKREHEYKVLVIDAKGEPSHVITREDILNEFAAKSPQQ
jgi:ACR3 family arsenite efflux pump ArsB/CBS domain-containing protein